ncbi:type IV secretory system conjugative DNA transfer family protein [Vibrio aerogenes]|uniref:type IV secretory system conjugative DNA transfer family protein n=1 Tax=Vibrio aerogenes TaxID=92172 RepID=UPI0021C44C7B|nr:type IV secretory system conjugative DNA transfer family protein [Vibrio aerogenes]
MTLSGKQITGLTVTLILLLIVMATLGAYVGAVVYMKLTQIPVKPYLSWHLIYDQWRLYGQDVRIRPYLQLAIAVWGTIAAIPFVLAGLVMYHAWERQELYGSARFSDDTDLSKSGLIPVKDSRVPGVLLGKVTKGRFKNRYLELDSTLFTIVMAGTRSGKGIGMVLPNCVSFPHNIVVMDIKFENFIKTAGIRQKFGQEVFLFAPDGFTFNSDEREGEQLHSHRWNCFDYVRRSTTYRVGDILGIASALYPVTGDPKTDMWNELASKLFKGIACWMLDTESGTGVTPSLPYVLHLFGTDGGLRAWMKQQIQNTAVSDDAKFEFNACLSMAQETYSSVESNLLAPLAIFSDKVVAASVMASDFDLKDLRRKRMSVYVGCLPGRLSVMSKLFNLFFDQLINENTKVLPEQDPSIQYQCLLVLDEFAAIGRINQIAKGVSYVSGYWLRFLTVLQDESQLLDPKLYGRETGTNLIKNHAAKVIYPPKEVDESVRKLSDSLGTKTVKRRKITHSYGKGHSRNVSHEEHKRPLMYPHEIVELGFEKHPVAKRVGTKILVLMENQRPLLARKLIYFDEPQMKHRVDYSEAHIPAIPLLSLD